MPTISLRRRLGRSPTRAPRPLSQRLGHSFSRRSTRNEARRLPLALSKPLALACFTLLFAAGCHHVLPVDTQPLDNAGMSFDSIEQLKKLNITTLEVTQIAQARQAGLSDSGCVAIMRIFHDRGQPFDAGETLSGLLQASMSEPTVIELAKLNQLGVEAGELQAMHLAGLSDDIVREVAAHHANGKPVLSGATLAGLKNTGLRSETLLELVRRSVPDSQADAIFSARRHGATDADILRRFASS